MPDIAALTAARQAGTLDRDTLDAALRAPTDGTLPRWAVEDLAWSGEDDAAAVARLEAALPTWTAMSAAELEWARWRWLGTIAADVGGPVAAQAVALCGQGAGGARLGPDDWRPVVDAAVGTPALRPLVWLGLAAARQGGAEIEAAIALGAGAAGAAGRLVDEVER